MIKNFYDNILPNGPTQGGPINGLINGFDVAVQGTAGLWVKDITRCGELIFDYEG